MPTQSLVPLMFRQDTVLSARQGLRGGGGESDTPTVLQWLLPRHDVMPRGSPMI